MMQKFFQKIDPFVVFCFDLHDGASGILARRFLLIKRLLLIAAYASLSGVFFPEWRESFGSLARLTLFLILFLSPLSKIFRTRLLLQMMGLRRELGILMGCLALTHGAAYFSDPMAFAFNIAPYLNADFFSMQPLFLFGFLSLLLTLVLFLTANDFSLRLLGGRRWKMLHRIVYVLFLTVLLHVFFVQNMTGGYDLSDLAQPVGIAFSYVLLKILAWRNFVAPLRDMINLVGGRYQTYAVAKTTKLSAASSL